MWSTTKSSVGVGGGLFRGGRGTNFRAGYGELLGCPYLFAATPMFCKRGGSRVPGRSGVGGTGCFLRGVHR